MVGSARLPLSGITVIALEQAVAAPFCTGRLADAGARVLKIERPEGDFARGYDDVANGQSSYFVWLNRGKESIVLDLASTGGKRTLAGLIENADVLVQNLKPGALARLGFAVPELRRAHPRLIVCSISGYDDSGPLADRKAYDLLVQAESGLCSITGGPLEPARVGISIVDIATGATGHAAILEALLARALNGDGADIRIAMFDVMADWLTVPLLNHEGGKSPRRNGLAHPSIAPYGAFTTQDGTQILISIQNDREWADLSRQILANESVVTDERFATNVARVRHRAEADALAANAFSSRDTSEVEEMLSRANIAFAKVNDMAALACHPHLRRITVETSTGPVSYPAPAPIVTNARRQYGRVPSLGDHARLPLERILPESQQ
jgi:itaconate CoA-transferase